jgi:monoamine oxidase
MQDVVKTQPDFFVLNLPNDKKQAILRARQGITNKVIIKFKEAIMDANLASFFPAQNEQAVICPTQWINFAYYDPNNTLNNSTTIMGLCYGERGNFSGKNDADILNAAIQELSTFLHIPIQELQQNISSYHITHWEDDPYARGAWDTNTIQEHTKDRLVILAPIDNKIYFAGDHVSAYGATTHGAFISGQDAATTLVQSLWKKYITKLEI